ncbi:hypothetical protein [Aquimarina aggregata]|uniref:hypothetical protein n=1 Tax=Aquimarina aggregata TaxID=1642818 RepID=UPI000A63F8BB|nr:hypothetical protein [Aquimarina aggregata]
MNKLVIMGIVLSILGGAFFGLGILFQILHWPGLYFLLFSGSILFFLGLTIILFKSKVK